MQNWYQEQTKTCKPTTSSRLNPEAEKNTSSLDWIYLFNYESCDASLMGLGICFCINNKDIGIWPIGDPKFVAIQNIVAAWRKKKKELKVKNEVERKQSYTEELRFENNYSGSIVKSQMSTHLQMLFKG